MWTMNYFYAFFIGVIIIFLYFSFIFYFISLVFSKIKDKEIIVMLNMIERIQNNTHAF